MHKSLSVYASALKCTVGQIRRHIRAGLIPSAKLAQGKTGRPRWVIEDVSPEAIEVLASTLQIQRYRPPTFWEPRLVEHFETQGRDGKPSVSFQIHWQEIFAPPPTAVLDILFDLADRAALVWHHLTREDLLNPPVHWPDKHHCVVSPPSERKIEAYYRTQRRLLFAWFRPRTSFTHRWVTRMADESIGMIDIMQAALQLSLYHKLYSIEIDPRNLSLTLGVSKSTLYRRYGPLIPEALRFAHRHATSAAQNHPDSDANGNRDSNEDLHETPIDEHPKDLPFQSLLDAATQLYQAGAAVTPATLTSHLRRERLLRDGEHVYDFYSDTVINNAIAAAGPAAAA